MKVIIVAVPIMNVPIIEDEKNQIKRYLLGQLAEADEERVELRLMSDPTFSEEFDVVVDEIATLYVSGKFGDDEKAQVEQYFLRSPERQLKVQFICELLSQISEDGKQQAEVVPVELTDQKPAPETAVPTGSDATVWQRISSFWNRRPSAFRPAISLAILLIVAALVFWVITRKSTPTYATLELSMTSAERNVGTQIKGIRLDPGVDGLRIKLKLPTPRAQQYRASLRGERVSLAQLTIAAQDAESMTVIVPANQITPGTYVIELIEINNGSEKPIRGAYEFVVVSVTS